MTPDAPFDHWIQVIPDAVIVCDREGKIAMVNSQAEILSGYVRDELMGRPLNIVIPDRLQQRHPDWVRAFFREPTARSMGSGCELFLRRKDGSELPVDIALSSLGGDEKYAVAAIRDMTAWREAEAEVRLYARRLEESNRSLTSFANVASHDLQAPLRRIRTFCELLEDHAGDRLDADGQSLLGNIADCADRLRTLVGSLLKHAQVDSRGPALECVDCEKLLDSVLGDCDSLIAESQAVITHDRLPIVQADRVQLSQLLQNLLGNAIKYRGERRPQVHFGAEQQAQRWLLSVRDNGIGIEPRHFDKIFEMFTRLHGDESVLGVGVGLATCKAIVKGHGGSIWVESQLDQGSVFYFTLPKRNSIVVGSR